MSADERTEVANLKSYIDKLENFSAEVETHAKRKRHDLAVAKNKAPLFSGEFKRPTVIEGYNPRNQGLVDGAWRKSQNKGTNFFITSNFNETIIWDNRDTSIPLMNRDIHTVTLKKKIKKDNDFNKDEIKKALEEMIVEVVEYIDNLKEKNIIKPFKPIGDGFILGLNSHLNVIVDVAHEYVRPKILRKWWTEQGYEPVKNFEEEHKRRIVKYTAYKLANKIVFYYIMKRSFTLPQITIPDNINTANIIKGLIDGAFEEAQKVSGDFEPIFESHEADKLLFSDNKLAEPIKSLVNYLTQYKFDTLQQDTLGNIYDKLISPEQRHALGQYYTKIPIVDLMNAFAIKKADDRIMDPSCGTWTYGIRAFDLKLKLADKDTKEIREKFLEEIFGIDIAPYPIHLAMMSMSSRLLFMDPKIYPKVIKKDFLTVRTKEMVPRYRTFYSDTGSAIVETLDGELRQLEFKPIDASISNLPYIRQEQIKNKTKQLERVKQMLEKHGYYEDIPDNSADFHIYFWHYILPFLKEGSRLAFLTSDTWMNVEYGEELKQFINKYFKIVAILDSSVERWFEDALVNTNIIVLRRESKAKERQDNKIKFIRLHKKVSELIPDIDTARKVVNDIEKGKSTKDIEIVRTVKQKDINFNDKLKSKLYPYLRAPKEFFEIVNNQKMCSLDGIMDVKRGFTTGANKFFYVIDITDSLDAIKLKQEYGMRKGETKKIRIIKDGAGATHQIEKEYVREIIKSPKEFTKNGKLIFAGNTKKKVIIINEINKSKIKKYAKKYINYGESNPVDEPYSERPTCVSRKPWWRLHDAVTSDMAFTMYFSSKYLYPKTNTLLDHTMYFGNLKIAYNKDLTAVYSFMNSSLSYFYPDMYGRNYGGGAAGFMVYETKLLPIPKPAVLRPYYKTLETIMQQMEQREIGSVFEEIWDMKKPFTLNSVKQDRLELDRTILIALGYKTPDKFLEKWYPAVVKIVKERLDRAASLKTKGKGNKTDIIKIAEEILEGIGIKDFPDDYITDEDIQTKIQVKKGKKIEYKLNYAGIPIVLIEKTKYEFEDIDTAEYVCYCAKRGIAEIPIPKDVKQVLKEFKEDRFSWRAKIKKEINNLTDDDKIKEKLRTACLRKTNYMDIL